jgi:hypothetical protein
MPNKGKRIASPRHKVQHAVSPDDVQSRLIEAAEREAADTRTPVQVWLGDPPPDRSALAQKLLFGKAVLKIS